MENTTLKLPPIFDSHAHYTDERFDSEYEGGAAALLSELFSSGRVGCILNVSTCTANSAEVIEMAKKYPNMYAAVGIHPSDIEDLPLSLEEQMELLERMLLQKDANKIRAVGEIGLDYYWEPVKKPEQKAFFEAQLKLAMKHDLPVVIHDREAHGDCFEMTSRYPSLRGVYHCYSGSAEMAKELVKKGFYISFGGTVTFKNARKTVEAAAAVPLERILLETDCPYLAPTPYRGKLNHSGLAVETAKILAEIKGTDACELIKTTYRNACKLFDITSEV